MSAPSGTPMLIAVALLWGVSLALPAIEVGGRSFDGFELLIRGWQGSSRGVYAWFANPLFGASLAAALLKRDLAAALLAGAAVVLGASSFLTEFVLAQRMASVPEITLRIGFYVWMAALLSLCLQSSTTAFAVRRAAGREGASKLEAGSGRSRD